MAWYLLRKTITGLLGLALAAGLSVAVPVYAQASSSSTVPLYWLNVSSADEPGEFGWIMDFLLTTSPDEVASAQALGWESGGIIGYISPVPAPGLVPLHRYYSPSATDHYYTTDPSEGAYALSIGYTDESITGYVVPAESALSVFEDTVPLYRYADLSAERNYHFYSTTLNPTYESYFQKTEGRLWTSE